MKKFFTITILSLLALQSGLIVLILQAQLLLNSMDMKKLLEEDESSFTEIVISKQAFNESKIGDDEFYYRNDLYDIRKIIRNGDEYRVTAIKDSDEKNILERIRNVFENSKTPKNKNTDSLQRLISLIFILPEEYDTCFLQQVHIACHSPFQENATNRPHSVPTPPPLRFS